MGDDEDPGPLWLVPAILVTLALPVVLLSACGDLGGLGGLDVLGTETGISPVDPVFSCTLQDTGVTLELCTDLDASELEASVSDGCGGAVACAPSSRVPGCLWHCPPPVHGGCNALESCWCPDLRVRCTPNPH